MTTTLDVWDSFCLVTPSWSVCLPDHPYDRDDPDGFMSRDEIVAYLERYATAVDAPVVEGVQVSRSSMTFGPTARVPEVRV